MLALAQQNKINIVDHEVRRNYCSRSGSFSLVAFSH